MEGSRSPTFDGPRIYSPPTVYQPRSPDLFSDNAQDEEGWTTYYNPDITENAQQWNTPPPPSSQWHSVRRQLFQDTDSESDQTMTLWTFIYRGQPPKFDKNTRANCLYVDHEDHYHFVFESSTHNKNRSIHRIIQAGKLDINQNMSILSTLQPVVSWDKFAAYLIRSTNYSCICIGNKLKHLANNLKIVPREATDCATLLRNDRAGDAHSAPLTFDMDAPGSPIFGGYNPMDRHVPSPDIFEDNNAQDDWVNYYPDYSGGGQPWSPQPDTQPIHDARRELFPDSPTEGEGQLFTFIYRGQAPRFDKGTKVNCIYVDHEDHYHFVFESSSHNKSRSMQRIIQAGHLDIHQNIPILSTLQPVINWDRFAAYLVRTNSPTICIGQKLIHLATNLKVIPREQRDCATLLRNDRAAKVKYDNIKRKRRIDLMSELVEQNDSRTLNELKTALTYEDRKNLYAEHGQQWKEAAELCIEAYCERLRREQESSLFQHYIQNNNHSRICQHPKDLTRGLIWLDALLQQNNINKDDFLGDLTKVMNKKETRKNAFVIEGPTTTGKSLMLKMICDNYIYGTVQRSGDHSQFFLMNLLNKAIALMEEPRITTLTVNDFKELLGGTPFDIHVKHQKDERLPRIP
ncbi:uncharacterized protein DEA37_0004125, partial [Paragonimus westermani]